jgi:arylsulfatase A-like enzyme
MPKRRPNFVLFLSDDQAWGDLSCMGATDLKTPHLDALAASGALLTGWYSNSPVCSPSRASLLTGRYPGNAGVRSILRGHRTAAGLPREVPTIAEALAPLGYRCAMFGKWHLGLAEGSRPHDHGFSEWFGFMAGCIDYYSHVFYYDMEFGTNPIHDLWENGSEIYRDGHYFTELVAERAVDFIKRASKAGQPFLMYVPFNAPHYPLHAPQRYKDRFADLPWDRQMMAALLSAMDDGVGAIRDALESAGVVEDTLLFFQSDNGPSRESRNWLDGRTEPYYGSRCPLKGHKFSLYEGGIRSPAIMSWPARIAPGRRVAEPGAAMDIFPTLLRAAGGEPAAYALDGLEVLPMVADGASSPHREIFWEMGEQTAVRRGNWKLVLKGQLLEGAPPQDEIFLADLEADPEERVNLRDAQPDVASELRGSAERWRRAIEERWDREWRPRLAEVGTTGYA